MKKYEPLNFEDYLCERVTYVCDECGYEVEQLPIILTSYPVQYQYKCPNCNWQLITTELYPRLEFTSHGGKKWIIPE